MTYSRTSLMAVSLMALAMAGCSSTRFSSLDSQPEPLPAAPTGNVTVGQLPPPGGPGTDDPSAFPPAPGSTGTDVASIAPADVAPPATAVDLTAGSVAGVWNVSVAGQSCRVATPQTKFGQGFRAGPLHCPPPIDGIKSWNVAGKQLTLYDESGSSIAKLYSSGESRFDGQTSTGQPVSLTR